MLLSTFSPSCSTPLRFLYTSPSISGLFGNGLLILSIMSHIFSQFALGWLWGMKMSCVIFWPML